MKSIGILTCSDLTPFFPSKKNPLYTHDDQLLVDALESAGYQVCPVVWNEGICKEEIRKEVWKLRSWFQEKNYDILIMRSCWDYSTSEELRNQFINMLLELKSSKINIQNPPGLMIWNMDKHYLLDLQKVHIPVVPSRILKSSESIDFYKLYFESGPFVIKPTISAGARDTFRIQKEEEIESFLKHFLEIRKNRDFIIQDYLKDVESKGEWSLVFIDGIFSHGLLKKPRPGNWLVQDELGGSVHWDIPPDNVIALGRFAMKAIPEAYLLATGETIKAPLYARVDILSHLDSLYISELEMIEPELFFLDRSILPNKPFQLALDLFLEGVKKSIN